MREKSFYEKIIEHDKRVKIAQGVKVRKSVKNVAYVANLVDFKSVNDKVKKYYQAYLDCL